MADGVRSVSGTWGPRELETLVGAYRAILQEICETGLLSALGRSVLSAREIRRLAAKEVFVAATLGVSERKELVSQALARLAARQG